MVRGSGEHQDQDGLYLHRLTIEQDGRLKAKAEYKEWPVTDARTYLLRKYLSARRSLGVPVVVCVHGSLVWEGFPQPVTQEEYLRVRGCDCHDCGPPDQPLQSMRPLVAVAVELVPSHRAERRKCPRRIHHVDKGTTCWLTGYVNEAQNTVSSWLGEKAAPRRRIAAKALSPWGVRNRRRPPQTSRLYPLPASPFFFGLMFIRGCTLFVPEPASPPSPTLPLTIREWKSWRHQQLITPSPTLCYSYPSPASTLHSARHHGLSGHQPYCCCCQELRMHLQPKDTPTSYQIDCFQTNGR